MEIQGTLVEGRFVARDNRFRVTVEAAGERTWAHLPNSGRLGELLVPGRRVLMIERPGPGRKTGYDLALVDLDGQWVSVDARLPNDLMDEALGALEGGAAGAVLEAYAGYETVQREVRFGSSRFDFALQAQDRPTCLLEIKSVTLVLDGLGCFPDAVTARGKRHLDELTEALATGYRAAVAFVVQRADARGVRPHDEADPEFGQALRKAARQGVEVHAYGCEVSPSWVAIEHCLPLHLA